MAAPRKIPHLRWYIAVLLCLASELNYLDRQALSVLATQIQKDVGFTDAQYGQITSAFLMSYSVMYLVSGRILDLIGTRRGYLYFVAAWSFAAMSHALARTQMTDFGGVLTFDLDADKDGTWAFIDALELFTTTASLGSTESLVAPVKLYLGTDLSAEEQARAQIKDSTVRFAVGIEHVDDLIADIDQALRKVLG